MQPKYNFSIKQNSDKWIKEKLGKFSASSSADLLMKRVTAGYGNLINRIAEERVTNKSEEGRWRGNPDSRRGHEFEHKAIKRFEMENFISVKSVGIVVRDQWSSCSPDGLINDDGLIQIKCPIYKTQREYLRKLKKIIKDKGNIIKVIDTTYYKQMQFELFITGRKYNVFYSYHPNLKPIKIVVERDEETIKNIELRLKEAIKDVELNINELK